MTKILSLYQNNFTSRSLTPTILPSSNVETPFAILQMCSIEFIRPDEYPLGSSQFCYAEQHQQNEHGNTSQLYTHLDESANLSWHHRLLFAFYTDVFNINCRFSQTQHSLSGQLLCSMTASFGILVANYRSLLSGLLSLHCKAALFCNVYILLFSIALYISFYFCITCKSNNRSTKKCQYIYLALYIHYFTRH